LNHKARKEKTTTMITITRPGKTIMVISNQKTDKTKTTEYLDKTKNMDEAKTVHDYLS
jgi:hypothetical protein